MNKLKNVKALNIALGSKVSEARIYDNLDINRGAASLIRPKNVNSDLGKKVKVTTIDMLIENGQISVPTLIKIDVEGFELEVLKGAQKLLRSQQAPILCVEYSSLHPQFGGRTIDIYRFIKQINDYSVYKLQYGKEVPSKLVRVRREHELPNHDNIFCFPDRYINEIDDSDVMF